MNWKIMIKLNLPVLLAQRGIRIADANRMTDMGRTILYRLYNNEVTRMEFDSLERLCKLLNCKSGDIILYKDEEINKNPNTGGKPKSNDS